MAAGLVLGAVAACCGRRLLSMLIVAGFPLLLALLVLVRLTGRTVNGSRSWLDLPGGFSLQPSELAKLGVICVLAWWLARRRSSADPLTWLDLVVALVLSGVPVVLILTQPDLGTVLVLSITVFVVLAVAGAGWRWLVPLVLLATTGIVAVIRAGLLADYQVDRFTAFLDPTGDVRGIGYNTHQARAGHPRRRPAGQGDSGKVRRPRAATSPNNTPTSSSRRSARSSDSSVPPSWSWRSPWSSPG